ncbi:hypothetical protein AVEN_98698-1 [Araneus ventricosus]|uniref:Uncharacterized protein n=1 Tax=Araneus ventricosus TaxID=182803 RepID=A0A4Y2VVW6_ARAVE|nr:hypothetical protein AVEN_98698-1 [Araneus ventricosus]
MIRLTSDFRITSDEKRKSRILRLLLRYPRSFHFALILMKHDVKCLVLIKHGVYRPYSQRILEILLPYRFMPRNDKKCMGRGYQENPYFRLEEACQRVLPNVALRSLRQYCVETIVSEIVPLAKIVFDQVGGG